MKKDSPKICRISKLKGFENILAGRDFANIFKEGHVYSVEEILGAIMIKDLGEYVIDKDNCTSFPSIIRDGKYLLVKKKYKKSLKNND
jgi:hypothetical protein